VPLSPGERITLIQEAASLLDKQDWGDIDLILSQHGLPTSDFDLPSDKRQYVIQMTQGAPDQALTTVHGYLTEKASGSGLVPGQSPWTGDTLRLFCSHLAIHQALVQSVADVLVRYGVEPFVAHTSIEPSTEWQAVIEAALTDCDAMLVFLHPGFQESNWCDQEVGWGLGRKRQMLALNYGVHPYGFLGKFQDQPCSTAQPYQVGNYVMDWLTKTQSLHGRLGPGLVEAFVTSRSWDFTRSVVPYLERIQSVSDDDLSRMEQAAKSNIDVRECVIGTQMGPEWVQAYVTTRRGPSSAPAWSQFPDEPPF
jgi:hypothetical protein